MSNVGTSAKVWVKSNQRPCGPNFTQIKKRICQSTETHKVLQEVCLSPPPATACRYWRVARVSLYSYEWVQCLLISSIVACTTRWALPVWSLHKIFYFYRKICMKLTAGKFVMRKVLRGVFFILRFPLVPVYGLREKRFKAR